MGGRRNPPFSGTYCTVPLSPAPLTTKKPRVQVKVTLAFVALLCVSGWLKFIVLAAFCVGQLGRMLRVSKLCRLLAYTQEIRIRHTDVPDVYAA